jgi:hypothetical protein
VEFPLSDRRQGSAIECGPSGFDDLGAGDRAVRLNRHADYDGGLARAGNCLGRVLRVDLRDNRWWNNGGLLRPSDECRTRQKTRRQASEVKKSA